MQNQIIIIGAGIVGLATAYQIQLKKPGTKVCIVEKESLVAKHQTGHNSGVLHSGIYYKPGSQKAINCFKGYSQMIDFCRENELPHEICGKIIVATNQSQLPSLNNIYERGQQNGLAGIRKIGIDEIKEIEPHVAGIEGIWVPQAGIIGYTKVAEMLAQKIQNAGGEILFGRKVTNIQADKSEITVETSEESIKGNLVINCAGLYSDHMAMLNVPNLDIRILPFRGEYYKLKEAKKYLVNNLIYPVPDPSFPFLGVHFTRMISGDIEAGPNAVLALKREGYKKTDVGFEELFSTLAWPGFRKIAAKYWRTGAKEMYRSFSKAAFTKALQELIPEIQENDLVEGGAGVRAQACDRKGNLIDDFMIIENGQVVNVLNAPSPAATSSLAIGETIADKIIPKLR